MNINYFMDLAKKEAKNAYLLNEIPVGAILVDNTTNLLISSAHNEIIRQKNSTKHAEMIVIEKACKIKQAKYLINTSIFITLEPCAMCAAAISEVRIDKIYFGAYDEKKGAIENGIRIFNNKKYFKPEIYGGIRENECSQILKNFFLSKRKSN